MKTIRGTLAIGFLTAIAVVAMGATAMSAAGKGAPRRVHASSSDPREPVRAETTLGSGRIGGNRWAIKVFSESQEGNHSEGPCLEARIEQGDEFESTAGCVEPGPLTATGEPLMVVKSEPVEDDSGQTAVTAVGFVLAPAVATVEAVFADGRHEDLPLSRLDASAARRANAARRGAARKVRHKRRRFRHAAFVGDFGYAAFAVEGGWCPQRLVSRNVAGEVLSDIEEEGCPTASGMRYLVDGISD